MFIRIILLCIPELRSLLFLILTLIPTLTIAFFIPFLLPTIGCIVVLFVTGFITVFLTTIGSTVVGFDISFFVCAICRVVLLTSATFSPGSFHARWIIVSIMRFSRVVRDVTCGFPWFGGSSIGWLRTFWFSLLFGAVGVLIC